MRFQHLSGLLMIYGGGRWGVTAGLSMKEFISADSNGRCCPSQDTASDLMTPGGSRQGG